MDEKTNIDLDLDILSPKAVVISYKGQEYILQPLSLENYAKLLGLSSALSKFSIENNIDEIASVYQQIRDFINSVLPDFTSLELNTVQLAAVFNLITKMNTPEDRALTELKKQGIELQDGGTGDPKG